MIRIFTMMVLVSIFAFGGSLEAVISCQSDSKRTKLEFKDTDLEGNFLEGFLSIDDKRIQYTKRADATIVSHLDKKIYTLYLYDQNASIHLEFYTLPKTVKKVIYKKGDKYKFKAIIDPASTDPRTKERVGKTIILNCVATYDWKEI